MSGMVICIVLFLLDVNLSVAQFYIRTPTNVTQKRILLSFNTDSIPACFQKCKETACCKDIATVKDKDKKSFECYLLRSNETNDDAEERLFEVYLTRSITNCEFNVELKEERTEREWYLGMNLNPDDGHIMDYTTGWDDGDNIGNSSTAFVKDYLRSEVWDMPVNSIAIVRHQKGNIDAVKAWKFKEGNRSMLNRFKAMYPGREIVTEGGPYQKFMIPNITNITNDPIFNVTGDLAMNWWYANNGARIALDGGYLSAEDSNDENTHGLGNHACANCTTGIEERPACRLEISNIQDCSFPACPEENRIVQGRDHGSDYTSGRVYGGYAIYVSKNTMEFPTSQTLALMIKSDDYVGRC